MQIVARWVQHRAFVLLFAVSPTFALCRALGLSGAVSSTKLLKPVRAANRGLCGKNQTITLILSFQVFRMLLTIQQKTANTQFDRGEPFLLLLPSEVRMDRFHPALLLHAEGAAALAMTAVQAGVCFDGELGIVVGGDIIPGQRKVVVLVDQTDVDACRTGLAVVTVYAGAGNGVCCKAANDGIVLFFVRYSEELQHLIQMLHRLYTGYCHQNTGAVDGILQTLAVGQRLPKGRMLSAQQLTGKEGLHHRNAHAFPGAALEQVEAFLHAADAIIIALLKIVGGVDGEHHHVDQAGVNDSICHAGGMGREADMPHDALRLEFLQVVQNTDLNQLVEILVLIHAVQKTEIYIIGPEGFQLPQEGLLNGIKVATPTVLAIFIIHRTEMALQENFFPAALDRSADGCIRRACGAQIKEVDAIVDGLADDRLDFVRGRQSNAAQAKAKDAEFLIFVSMG